ncbi:family 20 glycosylhydrolase, partial [Tritonibacter sp. SIMBA_163]|uniref:family 20 glycosylhydrolase n=1 Tax=Tritonibacter sp. SIMBA_163 TaxID=3080868 RepID=UPI00397F171E
MHEMVSATGKRMMMWGDHLAKEPRIIDAVPKDVIVCDWQYQPDVSEDRVQRLLDAGLDVIATPASVRSGEMLMPGLQAQHNLR